LDGVQKDWTAARSETALANPGRAESQEKAWAADYTSIERSFVVCSARDDNAFTTLFSSDGVNSLDF